MSHALPSTFPSSPHTRQGNETEFWHCDDGSMVQHEELEFEFAEAKVASEHAERLANLLTLSYEAMFAWRLDGPIEFWNAGAERLYGFSPSEAVGRSSHSLLQTKFPVNFPNCVHSY